MKTSRAAIRYAKALILESVEKNNLEQTFGDMKMVQKTFEENLGLSHLIESRVIKNRVKSSSLLLVFKEMSTLTKNLIRVLDDNNRINLFEIIAYKFIERYKQHKGIQSAIVTSAVPLNKEIEDQVLDAISKLTNKQTTILNKVDSSLIGGFVLRLGDIQYNASFKNKLKNIKQEFNKNTNLSIT